MPFNKGRHNTGLWFAALAATVILCVGAGTSFFIDYRVERLLHRDTMDLLTTEQATLSDIYDEDGIEGLTRAIARLSRSQRDPNAVYWLKTSGGRILATNLNEALPPFATQPGQWQFKSPTKSEAQTEVYALTRTLPDGSTLLVGRLSESSIGLRDALSEAFLAALAIVGVFALGLGLGLERLLRRRVDLIARTAEGIADGDLSQRVPLTGRKDEFDRLAEVLNAMLAQTEAQVLAMRTVTDSLAHDMRLPLTRIRARIEDASLADNTEARTQALEHALSGTETALGTFNTLLDIARADSGVGREAFGRVNLKAIVLDVVELFAPLAEEKGQTLVLDILTPDITELWGQGTLLRQALGNIVHNAIKYAHSDTPIKVSLLSSDGDEIEIIVDDHGPGIPVDQQERALKPFGRLARDGMIDGTGLGLALAAATARLHSGTLSLSDNRPGLRVKISLPLFEAQGTD